VAELIKAMISLTDLRQPDQLIIIKQIFLLYILSDCAYLFRNCLSNELNKWKWNYQRQRWWIVPLREDYNKWLWIL